jgi:hypothetical protein
MKELTEKEYMVLTVILKETETQVRAYHSLTLEQAGILKTDDTGLLFDNLQKRQAVIDEINSLQEKAKPYLQLYDQIKQVNQADKNNAKITEIEDLLGKIRDVLIDAQKIDDQNKQAAMAKKDLYGAEAKRLSKSRKSIRLYNGNELLSDPVFFDNKN